MTDDNGGHTEDSADATRIYIELQRSGYKPFFSEYEIGSRTGADYEALILYALYVCPCMIIVCSDAKYLETKWVKNEYTRYAAMIADEEKERGSITVAFRGKPIEKLACVRGKLQGISLDSFTAFDSIKRFIDSHDEGKKRAKEAAEREAREKAAKEAAEAEAREAREKAAKKVAEAAPMKARSYAADFEIKNGELIKYKGEGGKVTVPDGVTRIGDRAFYNCGALESVVVTGKVKVIGENAFYNCAELKSVELPESIIRIGMSAFENCKSLETINIPDSVTEIGDWAFRGCEALKSIFIPDSAKRIGEKAFAGCKSLKSASVSAGAAKIGEGAFDGSVQVTVRGKKPLMRPKDWSAKWNRSSARTEWKNEEL